MGVSFSNRLQRFQKNVYPAMLASLASDLSVSTDSLSRIGLGWVPIVTFKQGDNYSGWWTIPERDPTGAIVGLGLRDQIGKKVMFPGSKHGLIYEVNPQHEQGRASYQPGKHNWIRVADAKIDCPVCDKPDGCLVSYGSDNDPKAAICIRESSNRPQEFGFLHILSPEGDVTHYGKGVLIESDSPVVIVEGMTDTAAAMDLGFVAVGRPSNLACLDMLRELVRGRRVIVVGENDQKPGGAKPGEHGMVAAFQTIKTSCLAAIMVLPPHGIKDFREWKHKGLIREEFLEYVKENGQENLPTNVLPNDRPLTMAKLFLNDYYRIDGRYSLRNLEGQWFKFVNTKYKEISVDQEVRGRLHEWLDDKMIENTSIKTGATTLQPVRPNVGFLNNILDGMNAICPIYDQPPCWLNNIVGPAPRDLIVFENGILDVPKYLSEETDYLLPPTPDFFTLAALPYAFDPTAKCPTWQHYLETALGDDPDKTRLLQEWFGYCLTSDTTRHKLMFMQGPARSGKSTALRTLMHMVGKEQSATSSFSTLVQQFGLQELVGKLVVAMPEAVLPKTADAMQALQRLLSIVGEDAQNIPRKFLPALTGHRLMCRFTLAANEIPQLPDHAGALMSRLLILEYTTTFAGREDFDLERKLQQEIPGIILWSLEGLRRLRINGHFLTPKSSVTALEEWRRATSPIAAFLEECCLVQVDKWVVKDDLYEAWLVWSSERGMRPITKALFRQRIHANAPTAISQTHFQDGSKYSVFKGLALQPWAAKKLVRRV